MTAEQRAALRALARRPLDERTEPGTVAIIHRADAFRGREIVLCDPLSTSKMWRASATDDLHGDEPGRWVNGDWLVDTAVVEVTDVPVPVAALDELLDAADERDRLRDLLARVRDAVESHGDRAAIVAMHIVLDAEQPTP